MPYKLVKAKGGYFVETKGSNKKHSDHPLTHEKAVAQMRAMYANMSPAEKAVMEASRNQHGMHKKGM